MFNPLGNGNCSFECVAEALGYGDKEWTRVQKEMINKINKNKSTYAQLQGGQTMVKEMVKNLQIQIKSNGTIPNIKEKNCLSTGKCCFFIIYLSFISVLRFYRDFEQKKKKIFVIKSKMIFQSVPEEWNKTLGEWSPLFFFC